MTNGLLLLVALALPQQQQSDTAKPKKPFEPPPIFMEAKPIEMQLHAPFSQLRKDRAVDTEYRPGWITYKSDAGDVRVPARLRTRGIWRKKNCEIPPLLVNFTKDSTKKTLFAKNDRLRLTLHCRNNDEFEQYVLQEYNLYRVHRQLTPYSYDVRLARVTYIDSEKKDTLMTRWAFWQEQDDAFAERVGVKLTPVEGAGPADLVPYESALFGVVQYFVANTDYSVRALHNVVLVMKDDVYIPVARDFDWSGAVNARYATPNPLLKTRTVTQRVMRGLCAPEEEYNKVFELFKAKKDAIYGLYKDELMAPIMKPNVVNNTLKYFDEFYAIINDPRKAKREIVEQCLGGSA
jgi:hypothetical protein